MKIKLVITKLLFLITALIFYSCDTTEPGGDNPKPPGYQEDILWPSLADSPWPMHHHDPQSTGRSKYLGPQQGAIDWTIDSLYTKSGVSIGPDSTIYFTSTLDKRGLFAVNPDGSIKWVLEDVITNVDVITTPLIASDGTIYIGGGLNGKLYAINPNGTIKWEVTTLGFVYHAGLNIGLDGTIYLLNGGPRSTAKLVAVSKSGNIEWSYENEAIDYESGIGTAISPDGNTIYVPGYNPTILAIEISTHTLKWTFGKTRYGTTPTVDNAGNIYLVSRLDSINNEYSSIFCLYPSGDIKWSYTLPWKGDLFRYISEGSIDKYGNYYFGLDTLYSFDYSGNVRWKLDINHLVSSIVNDINGNVYFKVYQATGGCIFYSVSNVGNILWSIDLDMVFPGHSPAIGTDGIIYLTGFKEKFLYAIK